MCTAYQIPQILNRLHKHKAGRGSRPVEYLQKKRLRTQELANSNGTGFFLNHAQVDTRTV